MKQAVLFWESRSGGEELAAELLTVSSRETEMQAGSETCPVWSEGCVYLMGRKDLRPTLISGGWGRAPCPVTVLLHNLYLNCKGRCGFSSSHKATARLKYAFGFPQTGLINPQVSARRWELLLLFRSAPFFCVRIVEKWKQQKGLNEQILL